MALSKSARTNPATTVTSDISSAQGPSECAAALFSYDFGTGGVDYDTIETLHRGEIGEWISALERSGMLAEKEIAALDRIWREQPSLLFDILLRDADQMTARRCRLAWSAMDRLAPFVMPLSNIG